MQIPENVKDNIGSLTWLHQKTVHMFSDGLGMVVSDLMGSPILETTTHAPS